MKRINTDMSIEIDGIKLDPENKQFFQAAELVRMSSQNIIYLTGKAGTGKTTFLKYVMETYQGGAIVLAPTGVAAVNAHGQTIHSFFQLEMTPYPPGDQRLANSQIYERMPYKLNKRELIKNLSLIIIDEVSMVRCDMLDAIDIILRAYRHSKEPFGGIKMLLVGDLFQLPPIAKPQDDSILRNYYKSMYFFDSFVYQRAKTTFIELEKPYRQTEAEFIDILNKVRINQLSNADLATLNKRSLSLAPEGSIYLAPLNSIVNSYNNKIYNDIDEDEITFYSEIEGNFPNSMKPVADEISLKVGAQVMIMKNKYNKQTDTFEYYNGSIGEILEIDEESYCVTVRLNDNNNEVDVYPATWGNVEFIWDAQTGKSITNIIGKYSQIPLKLAWAITIHKSQGLTFDNVTADLNNCFDTGQVYVALSRCRKLSGLFLKSPLRRSMITVDPVVVSFSKLKTPETMIVEQIETGKADTLYKDCRIAFENNDTEKMLKCYKDATKIRDDFETPEFRKFIKVKVDLFYHYKEKCKILWGKLMDKDNDILKLSQDLFEAHETIEDIKTSLAVAKRNAKKLQTDKNTAKRTLQETKNQYKNLQEELDLSKKEFASQKEKYSFMENILKKQLDKAREENAVLEEKFAHIQKELNNANNEIRRLQNLSLWDRIRGKK